MAQPYVATVQDSSGTKRDYLRVEGISVRPNDVEVFKTTSSGSLSGTVTLDQDLAYSSAVQRGARIGVKALTGAAIHAGTGGVVAWQNPEGADIMVTRVILDLTTVSSGACTLDVGYTVTSATTTSDTFLDGVDANAAVTVFDSMDPLLDTSFNAHAQKVASGKWVTIDEKSGDATGLVANLYIHYFLI